MKLDDADIPTMDSDLDISQNLNITGSQISYDGARVTTEQVHYMLLSWFSYFPRVS